MIKKTLLENKRYLNVLFKKKIEYKYFCNKNYKNDKSCMQQRV